MNYSTLTSAFWFLADNVDLVVVGMQHLRALTYQLGRLLGRTRRTMRLLEDSKGLHYYQKDTAGVSTSFGASAADVEEANRLGSAFQDMLTACNAWDLLFYHAVALHFGNFTK